MINRRKFLLGVAAGTGAAWAESALSPGVLKGVYGLGMPQPSEGFGHLEILGAGYPRAFFFRLAEGFARQHLMSYEEWERCFVRLDGIMAKVLDEEIPGNMATTGKFLNRFKTEHPEKMAVAHVNGRARDPRWQASKFFAGHWLYLEGCKITSDLPAQGGEATVSVEDPNLFHAVMGHWHKVHADLGVCALDREGRPDWHRSEQVVLLSVDYPRKTMRIRRGCYGTEPRAFQAGNTYVAAHWAMGPWTDLPSSHLIWAFNFSTLGPRDAQGRSCVDILVDDMAQRLLPGGDLANLDGVELDADAYAPTKQADTNADGKADGGIIDGVNHFGLGLYEYIHRLRGRVGNRKLIMADGNRNELPPTSSLNGRESEGWPTHSDHTFLQWASGMNELLFWHANTYEPTLSYINYGWSPKDTRDIPLSFARLDMAATCLAGTAFTYRLPPPDANGQIPDWTRIMGFQPWRPGVRKWVAIYDELKMGTENKDHWLGQPVSPLIRLALRVPDLLEGKGERWPGEFVSTLERNQTKFEKSGSESDVLKISSAQLGLDKLTFKLPGVKLPSSELVVRFRVKADPRQKLPKRLPRLLWVGLEPAGTQGTVQKSASQRLWTWSNSEWVEAVFYFRDLTEKGVNLIFEFEGSEPAYLKDLSLHAHSDVVLRDFEHGVVLANPSTKPYEFDLGRLVPHTRLRRLRGSPGQDQKTNNGKEVGESVTVPPLDALFLVKVR